MHLSPQTESRIHWESTKHGKHYFFHNKSFQVHIALGEHREAIMALCRARQWGKAKAVSITDVRYLFASILLLKTGKIYHPILRNILWGTEVWMTNKSDNSIRSLKNWCLQWSPKWTQRTRRAWRARVRFIPLSNLSLSIFLGSLLALFGVAIILDLNIKPFLFIFLKFDYLGVYARPNVVSIFVPRIVFHIIQGLLDKISSGDVFKFNFLDFLVSDFGTRMASNNILVNHWDVVSWYAQTNSS